jgi:hypothetical protein
MSDEQRKHHPYSPSTLQNLEYCPCYRGQQSDTPHERTVAGTRAHGVVESGEDDQRLSDEDAVAAAECLDFVEQRKQLMAEEARREAERSQQVTSIQEIKETYLPIDDLKFHDAEATTAGYVDEVLINWDQTRAEMFDWKFGRWAVEEAGNNLQGIAYSLGLFRRFPTLNEITFYFKQPHLDLVSQATFTRAQVPELYLRVQTVVARAREARQKNDFATAKPAVPVCNFCAELGRCEKVCAFACKVGRKFHPLEMPENITPTVISDPKQTALGLRLAAVLKVWCDAFRRQVTDKILRGEAELPPGQKIQEMSKRELVDMAKLRAVALKYLTTAEYESTLECTFGSLESIISENAPRGQKKQAVEEFKQALLDAGAVKMGDKFSFLRAVAVKD